MKIGIISEAYPPMAGGVSTSARRIATGLAEASNSVIVITYDSTKPVTADDYKLEACDDDVHVYRVGPAFSKTSGGLPECSRHSKDRLLAELRRRQYDQMLRILKMERPDILLSLFLLDSGWHAQMLANELDLPCIAGVRGIDVGINIFRPTRFAITQWVLNSADAIACVNEHLKRRACNTFKEIRSKTYVIPNGFDFRKLQRVMPANREQAIRDMNWSPSDLIVVFIGSLREKKGAATLLKALKVLNSRKDCIRLLIVGPDIDKDSKMLVGPLWDELLERNIVRTTGLVGRDEVLDRSSSGDVICIPSLDDGMANGLLEGMAVGLCPITTTVLGDVVTDKLNGLVIEPGNVHELAAAIKTVYDDRTLLSKYARNAQITIEEHFTIERERDAYLALFRRVINSKLKH